MLGNEKDLPLVSVVILSYNNLMYIKDCIDSILEQNYPKIELIICDDASKDFNADYLKKYIESRKQEKIKSVFIHTMQENGGTSKNFNFALRHTNGKYVKYIAADDLLSNPESIFRLVDIAEKKNSKVVVARALNYDQYLERHEWTYPSDVHWNLMTKADSNEFFGLMSEYSLISSPAVLYNKNFLLKNGGADENYIITEDWPLWMKMTAEETALQFITGWRGSAEEWDSSVL